MQLQHTTMILLPPTVTATALLHQLSPTIQGSTAVWRPQWMEFPELIVRADVVVRGSRLDEALGQLAGLLTSDLADLDAVPVFFVQGLQLVEPLSELALDRPGRLV
jgi:hypothetical protein